MELFQQYALILNKNTYTLKYIATKATKQLIIFAPLYPLTSIDKKKNYKNNLLQLLQNSNVTFLGQV